MSLAIIDTDKCQQDGCPGSDAKPMAVDRWRSIPLTVGLLVALIAGAASVLVFLESRNDRSIAARKASIEAHSHSEQSHPGIRTAIKDSEQRIMRRIDRFETAFKALTGEIRKWNLSKKIGR